MHLMLHRLSSQPKHRVPYNNNSIALPLISFHITDVSCYENMLIFRSALPFHYYHRHPRDDCNIIQIHQQV
jgi:hypothetical protein